MCVSYRAWWFEFFQTFRLLLERKYINVCTELLSNNRLALVVPAGLNSNSMRCCKVLISSSLIINHNNIITYNEGAVDYCQELWDTWSIWRGNVLCFVQAYQFVFSVKKTHKKTLIYKIPKRSCIIIFLSCFRHDPRFLCHSFCNK